MPEQLSLFETRSQHPPKYSLFLAIFPDHHTAQQIINLGNMIRGIHGLHGKLRPLTHLHVTLLFLGHVSEASETLVEGIGHICRTFTLNTRPFEIKFSRVLSFRGRPGNHPLVLVDDNHGNDGVRNLQEMMRSEFSKCLHMTCSIPNFVPHLTLLYDKHHLPSKPVDPISWLVKEVVLVRSEVGATKYNRLGHWLLGE